MKRFGPVEWMVAALMVGLVLVVFAQVAIRYLTYQPLAWTEETARLIFVWLCMLGAAVASQRGAHFGVDFLERHLSPGPRAALVAGLRLVEAMLFGVFTWAGVEMVRVAHFQTAPSLGFPMSFAYGCIPVAGALMVGHNLFAAGRVLLRREA